MMTFVNIGAVSAFVNTPVMLMKSVIAWLALSPSRRTLGMTNGALRTGERGVA
jgi:hypothetical protein